MKARLIMWLSCAAIAVAALSYVHDANAATRRYAVVIGINQGGEGDVALLYAERDAARVADVMIKLGGVHQENMVLLRAPVASHVERALRAVAGRVRADSQAGDESIVYVYYSGHADAAALRLGDTRLTHKQLRALVAKIPATVRVLIVDACRSGDVTRVKGAKPAEPFTISAAGALDAKGTAIITSSAAGEDAQESDRLKGGIFTHHLVTGLAGAADKSGDAKVTLTEAYRYAYGHTLRTTSSAQFVQHPTYSFQLRGQRGLVVTQLASSNGYGQLQATAGRWVLFSSGGDVVAELLTEDPTVLALAAGDYLIRHRAGDTAYEANVRIAAGKRTAVAPAMMDRVSVGRTVRKGIHHDDKVAGALTSDFTLGGPLLDGFGPGYFGSAGIRFDFEPVSLWARLRYGRYFSQNGQVELTQNMLGADVALLKLFDLGAVAPGVGVRVGFDWIGQTFASNGETPSRTAWSGRAGPLAHLDYSPLSWLSLSLEGGADIYLLEQLANQNGDAKLTTPVVPYGTVGFGIYLF